MTRKDYKLMADSFAFCLANFDSTKESGAIWFTIGNLVSKLQQDNPRFDESKFESAIREGLEHYKQRFEEVSYATNL